MPNANLPPIPDTWKPRRSDVCQRCHVRFALPEKESPAGLCYWCTNNLPDSGNSRSVKPQPATKGK